MGGGSGAHPKQINMWPCCVAPSLAFWIGLCFQKVPESPLGSRVTLLCESDMAGHASLGLRWLMAALYLYLPRGLGGPSRAHVVQWISGQELGTG